MMRIQPRCPNCNADQAYDEKHGIWYCTECEWNDDIDPDSFEWETNPLNRELEELSLYDPDDNEYDW
jgi:hypothetical protein